MSRRNLHPNELWSYQIWENLDADFVESFRTVFDAMITSQDMDGIDLFGKKLPKKAQLLRLCNRIILYHRVMSCYEIYCYIIGKGLELPTAIRIQFLLNEQAYWRYKTSILDYVKNFYIEIITMSHRW